MRGELRRADHPERLGRRRGVHRHDVGLGEQVVERSWVASSRTGRSEITRMPRPSSRHSRGPADRAEADEAGGAAGQLPGPVALVGDRAVAEHLAGSRTSRSARQEVAVDGEQQRDVISATPSALRPGRVQHGDAGCGGRRDVDVGRVAAGRADGPQRPLEHLALHEVGLADEDGGAELVDPLGQLRRRPRCAAAWWSIHGIEHDVADARRSSSSPGPRKLAVTSATGRSGRLART